MQTDQIIDGKKMNSEATEKSKLKNEKFVGYVLLTLGVALLVFSIFEMLYVYSGNGSPPKLFNFQDFTLSSTSVLQGSQLSLFLNLFFWLLLMFFVLFAGGKIASLGVNMIKDIKVQVKEPLLTPEETKKNEANEVPNAKT